MNPDVTVRNRGVMEKCTYCVQRIERARINARIEQPDDQLRAGRRELQTACQQACPTQAITFGSLQRPAARASRSCTRTSAPTSCCTSWAPARAPPTSSGSRNPNPALSSSAQGA